MDPRVVEIARAIRERGGRALVVGGYVRDLVLGRAARDVDVEVFGLAPGEVADLLGRFGRVLRVGRSFGVLRVAGLDVDFSIPEALPGSRETPAEAFARSARRRDLRINSMGLDPLDGEILDPCAGRRDLEAGMLRATNPDHFGDDPLRGLRVARFHAVLELEPDAELARLCSQQDLSHLPGERLLGEWRQLLLEARRPSLGLAFLERCGLTRYFPELAALIGVPQDPRWHPEGDVWTHTLMVVDEAARLRSSQPDDLALLWSALCHDLGKPQTTIVADDHIRCHGHAEAGVPATERLLTRLRAPKQLVTRVCALVEHHLAPALFVKNSAGARGYRRLARRLERAGVSFELLLRVARADHLGRTTPDALAREFPAGDVFEERAARLSLERHGPRDVVLGRHLIARGLAPGPEFGPILARCRALQDELGETDPDVLLDRVLSAGPV